MRRIRNVFNTWEHASKTAAIRCMVPGEIPTAFMIRVGGTKYNYMNSIEIHNVITFQRNT